MSVAVKPIVIEDLLARRARDGDREALEALARRFYPAIRAFLARLLGDQEAEDAAQDVFLRVSRGLETYRGEFRFSTWIFQIALNRARDLGRRRRPEDHRFPEPAAGPLITSADDRRRLFAAVRRLPSDFAEPLLLVHQQGLSHAEAAEVLGLSTAAVKMRVHRAIRQLRPLLAEERP
jgi:RNA polymerase sigma-70 factor (ECF subfamily)